MPDIHAQLSASSAKKWLNCPGSLQLEEAIPGLFSEYAKEGTSAHSLGEAKIRLALREISKAKYSKIIKKLDVTEDMEQYTNDYRDYVLERLNAARAKTSDAILMLEEKLDFSNYAPGGFGTGDAVIIANRDVEIIDLKYGVGVQVQANNNPQLMLYALGALSAYDFMYDIDNVIMTIYQPRVNNINSATISVANLEAWGELEVKPGAKEALDPNNQECRIGSYCDDGFCKARPTCRAYADEKLRLAKLDFKKPNALSIDEIAEVLEQAERLAKWSSLVKDYALDQAINHSVTFPGYKLVEGRSNRMYAVDDTLVAATLIGKGYRDDDIWPRKLKGITDMEKILGKKVFNELLSDVVIKPAGKPALVSIDDNRPELNSTANAIADFKNIIEKKGDI